MEGNRFQVLLPQFTALDCVVVGVSHDPVPLNKAFSDSEGFTYPLLCDTQGTIITAFDAIKTAGSTKAARVTAVVAPDMSISFYDPNFDKVAGPDALLAQLQSRKVLEGPPMF